MATRDNNDDIDNVFKSRRYIDIMQKVEDARIENHKLGGGVDDTQLIVDCNALSVEIDKEIVNIHDKDQLISPELELLVHHPIEYARVVKRIGNEIMDPTTLVVGNLEGPLPSAIIMVFSCWQLGKAIETCDRVLALHSAKKKLLDFIESRMGYIAPNLCAIVGSAVAAELVTTAGGLSSLEKMTPRNFLRLGDKRTQYCPGEGEGCHIEQCEIIKSTPPDLRKGVRELVAFICIHVTRVDLKRKDPAGKLGTSFRVLLEKWRNLHIETN